MIMYIFYMWFSLTRTRFLRREQVSEAALADAAQLLRDAQERLADTEANFRSSRANVARLQAALEVSHEAHRTDMSDAKQEHQRLKQEYDGKAGISCAVLVFRPASIV